MPVAIPPEVLALLETWDASSVRFLVAGYLLVGLGILSGLAVTAFTSTLPNLAIKTLGFVSAACTGLLAAYHPIEVGNSFRDAWRVLNAASLEYKLDEKKRTADRLVEAVREGESLIARAQGGSSSGRSPTAAASSPK
jgi:hypothetical protein